MTPPAMRAHSLASPFNADGGHAAISSSADHAMGAASVAAANRISVHRIGGSDRVVVRRNVSYVRLSAAGCAGPRSDDPQARWIA